MDRDELAHRLEVRANIAREAARERDLYERGVKAMRDAQGMEATDYAVDAISEWEWVTP